MGILIEGGFISSSGLRKHILLRSALGNPPSKRRLISFKLLNLFLTSSINCADKKGDQVATLSLRAFSAKIEFTKNLLTENKTELSVIASIQLGLLTIAFSGTGYLKGKQPLLPFFLNKIELKSDSKILFARSLKEPEEMDKSFFSMIALEENDELLSARGQGGAVVIWLKD